MRPEKWKTSVIGVGPWIVSDNDDPYNLVIGQFRVEAHADLFVDALNKSKDAPDTGEGGDDESTED